MTANIAHYSFLSWFRRGLAASLDETDSLESKDSAGDRSIINLSVKIRSGSKNLDQVSQSLSLIGPGDIIGIDSRAVIKTEPRAGTRHFEPNYIPYIEFYDEDFPWRYTPLSANNDRLRPWFALFVLEEEEYELLGLTNARLPAIRIISSSLPGVLARPDQNWAWAHCHLNAGVASLPGGGPAEDKIAALLVSRPDSGCSRILCPRKLKAQTNYTGFLVPAFEQGRLAGLGADTEKIASAGKQQSSWGQPHAFAPDQWPVYYKWSFRTGAAGDFESLARMIKPEDELDQTIGQRIVDIQSPGYALQYAGGGEDRKGTIIMEGALRRPNNRVPPLTQSNDATDQAFVSDLAALINLEEDLRQRNVQGKYSTNPNFPGEKEVSIYDDPIVTTPFYGKHHARKTRVEINHHWYNELNLNPQYRMAAGLGTEIVQKRQEDYMARAWRQFGDIVAANQRIRRQQLSLELSASLYRKHFKSNRFRLKPPDLTVMTSMIHSNVKNGEKTVYGVIDGSQAVSNGFANPTYIKMTRQRGPLMRRIRARRKPIPFKDTPSWTNWGVVGANTVKPILAGQFTPLFKLSTSAKTPSSLPKAFADHFQRGRTLQPQTTAGGVNILEINKNVLKKMAPQKRIGRRLASQVNLPADGYSIQFDIDRVNQIMAAPIFTDPMYKALAKLSTDYLLPSLDKIPMDRCCLFENNEAFIESYLVGLNHEMARELLWREFPTDQRGSYFKQFWDVSDNLINPAADINPIHRWPADTALGDSSHSPRPAGTELIFAIRAQLLAKYPNTIVYMHRAKWLNQNEGRRALVDGTANIEFPQFDARIEPEIAFFGFNKTVAEALGDNNDPGWFFVLKERAGELRFGLDIESEADQSTWDNLSWQAFPDLVNYIDLERDIPDPIERGGIIWGKGVGAVKDSPATGNGNAADMAWILFQKPFMVAIHASELLNSN